MLSRLNNTETIRVSMYILSLLLLIHNLIYCTDNRNNSVPLSIQHAYNNLYLHCTPLQIQRSLRERRNFNSNNNNNNTLDLRSKGTRLAAGVPTSHIIYVRAIDTAIIGIGRHLVFTVFMYFALHLARFSDHIHNNTNNFTSRANVFI